MKSIYLVLSITSFIILSCSYQKVPQTGIDALIQKTATIILREQLLKVKADSGLVLVMDVERGQIKAKTSLKLIEGTLFISGGEKMFTIPNEPGSIFLPIVLMASLETGKISINDSVDTERGSYEYRGLKIYDACYSSGGFGKITREQAIVVNSNIGAIRTIEDAFGDSIQCIPDQLKKMSLGEPFPEEYLKNKFLWNHLLGIGYEIKLSPLQIITFYNAIANNGKMVFEDKVLNAQIASEPTIKAMQETLAMVVSHGDLDFANETEQVPVAGKTGWARHLASNPVDSFVIQIDVTSFCGYFPEDKPRYTCLVMIYGNNEKLESDVKIVAPIFRKMAERMISQERS